MEEKDVAALSVEERKKSMGSINADGMAYSVMTGVGDGYLPAALVALGATDFWIGMLAALPQFFGAMLQSVSLTLLRALKDRKLIVMAGSLLQALSWLPIIVLLLWPSEISVQGIIVLFSIGFGMSLMINPVWSSWIADIVPENERASFFANRNKLMQIMLFIVTFGTGLLLDRLEVSYGVRIAFAAVFCIPFLARMATVYYHLKTCNVKYEVRLMNEIGLKHLFLLPSYKNELWFLIFIALMNFSVMFASPFFTPYMLNSLKFDIGMLGMLTAMAILAKVVSFPYWGKAIDRFSNRTVLVTTAFTVPLVPLFWLFTTDFWALAAIQVVTGFLWAGYDLAVFNSALSIVGRDLRPSFISKYNAFAAFSNGIGAICGGIFLATLGWVSLLGFSGILLVFLLSGVGRLLIAAVFSQKLLRSKDIANTSSDRAMIVKLVAIYPTQGAVQHVMHGWDFTRKVVRDGTETGGIALRGGLGATGRMIKEGGRKVISKITRKRKL